MTILGQKQLGTIYDYFRSETAAPAVFAVQHLLQYTCYSTVHLLQYLLDMRVGQIALDMSGYCKSSNYLSPIISSRHCNCCKNSWGSWGSSSRICLNTANHQTNSPFFYPSIALTAGAAVSDLKQSWMVPSCWVDSIRSCLDAANQPITSFLSYPAGVVTAAKTAGAAVSDLKQSQMVPSCWVDSIRSCLDAANQPITSLLSYPAGSVTAAKQLGQLFLT